MGAAMICLAWMSLAVLYWAVSHFLARPIERKFCSAEQDDSLRPLFEAIVYSRSWIRKSVNSERGAWILEKWDQDFQWNDNWNSGEMGTEILVKWELEFLLNGD